MGETEPDDFSFATERLVAQHWHDAESETSLVISVQRLLAPAAVTRDLPADWQGPYSLERAQQWIDDRDNEGHVLLVNDRETGRPVGLLFLSNDDSMTVRLGYLIGHDSWGKGLATELVRGLVDQSGRLGIRSLLGGVMRGNDASCRVLEKCGFTGTPNAGNPAELVYRLELVD